MKIPRLRLETPSVEVLGGEPWEGAVVVDVDGAVRFDAVVMSVGWRTHGRADVETHEEYREVIYKGRKAGRHGFSVPMPHGPYTYHGHYTNLDWYAVVSLELGGKELMSETNELVLLPSAKAPMRGALTRSAKSMSIDQVAEEEETIEEAKWTIVACAVLYALWVVGVVVWWLVTSGEPLLYLAGGLGVAACLVFFEVKTLWTFRRMGEVRLEVGRSVRVGDCLDVSWEITPNVRVKVRSVKATLWEKEYASSEQGTMRYTEVEEVVCVEHVLMEEGVLEPSERVCLEAKLRVPEGSSPSFKGRDSEVRWVLVFEVDVASGPDWTRSLDVHVGPKRR